MRAATFLILACLSVAARADYLSDDLRARVEQLKTDVASTPTTQATAFERSRTLFDWINAFALAGRYVPVNVTAVVAQINAYGVPAGPVLDLYVRELTLLDEKPGSIGSLTAETGPFTVRSHARFTQTYTVGSTAIETGGGFLVSKHFQANHAPFQTDQPGAANYLTISSTNPGVDFSIDSFAVQGMHGGFRGAAPQLVFRISKGRLLPGDKVTITYGDTSEGGPGLSMPDFTSDQMPFPLYVDLDGSNLWISLPIQPIQVIGEKIHGVAGFAPSILATDETFSLSIRAEDEYGNRATGDIPDWEIHDGSTSLRDVRSSNRAVVVSEGIRFSEPGVYRLEVRSKSGRIAGPVNPILVVDNPKQRIYWGDTHGHSGFAEGIGSAEAYMRFAREDARLDFVTHSEHDIWMDDLEWETLRDLVKKYTVEGEFIAYLGYEWTVRQSGGGHHNVLFRTPDGRDRVPSQFYPVLSSLYQGLREKYDTKDVLTIPHAHQKGDYRLSDPEIETLVEVMSMHGTFEWFGRMYLSHGHEVGFTAASDDHIGRPGYAQPKSFSLAQRNGLGAIIASERTTDAIFDAMKSLQAYATSGQRMILQFGVNGTPMGQRAKFDKTRKISGRVIGTSPIQEVVLFRNDKIVKEWHYVKASTNELALSFYSESHPFHPQDNPRGWRHWRGTIEVEGAQLDGAKLVDFDNHHAQSFTQEGNRVTFATHTRGDNSTILLRFADDPSNAKITITLADARETGGGPPILRRHQMITGSVVTLDAADLARGIVSQQMMVDGYDDRITLSKNGDAPLDVTIEMIDKDDVRHGDYYFIRARQLDEGLAWSSPVWVGGNPPR
jgi:hypothetical protein